MSDTTNETVDDAELAAWAEDFRADGNTGDGGRDDAPSADEIVREARRQEQRHRRDVVVQVVSLLFAIAVFLGLLLRTRSMVLAALTAIVLPTLVGLFGVFVHLRQAVGQRTGTTVASYVAFSLRGHRAEERILRANRTGLAVLALVFWAWLPVWVLSRADRFASEPWRLAVGASVAMVIFAGAWWHLGRKVRQARAARERMERIAASLE